MTKSKTPKPNRRQQKSQRIQQIMFAAVAVIIILSMVLSTVRF
jgi:predicted nucleic acid-binding Zn ribbon protein